MATKQQAETYARQESWRHKQVMHVVARGSQFFAASNGDITRDPSCVIVATFNPIKNRAGAKVCTTA